MDSAIYKKFTNLKLGRKIGEYLIGILFMPWIWAWGLLVLEFILISYYNSQSKAELDEFNLLQIFQSKVDLAEIMLFVTVFVFGNYSLAFLTRKTIPKLNLLLFSLTLFSLAILFGLIWPHFLLVLNQN